MAFSKSYLGDTKALEVVLQTVAKKNAIIPGITVKADLAGMVQANVAEFYYNLAPIVDDTKAIGEDFNATQAGAKKASIYLEKALQIDEKVPNAAIETTAADVVYDRMVKGALALTNALGKKFITHLATEGQLEEYAIGTRDMYEVVVDAIGDFSQAEVAIGSYTYKNAEHGVQPTTILVGDFARAALLKTAAFQRLIGDSKMEIPGLIGDMLGLKVVYSQDLDAVLGATRSTSANPGFILLNVEGVAYPHSINVLRVVESENFNGFRVQGEIGYPDTAQGTILPIKTFAIKFVKAV